MLKDTERLEKLIKYTGFNANKLAGKLGYSSNTVMYHILSGRNKISEAFAYKVSKKFPEINSSWLLTGKGNMLTNNSETSSEGTCTACLDYQKAISDLTAANKSLSNTIELLSKKL